jgi:hypothetical protein
MQVLTEQEAMGDVPVPLVIRVLVQAVQGLAVAAVVVPAVQL